MKRRIAVVSTLWFVGSHMPVHARSAEGARDGSGMPITFRRDHAPRPQFAGVTAARC
jgi:hypothetical protein